MFNLLISKISAEIKKTPYKTELYRDYLSACVNEGSVEAHRKSAELREMIAVNIASSGDVAGMHDVYEKSLLFDAPVSFDAYMLYLEKDRPAAERFYQPRRKIMKQLVDAMQMLADDELDELFLSMPPRVGKLLADDTPVLTTSGWKNHGDIVVGDYVFGADGKPKRVIAVHPKHHTTHTVTMADGSQFDCHFRHEWRVWDRRFGKERILETQDLIGHIENGGSEHKRGHRYNFMVELHPPIEGISVELPVKPYTFGAWLGDGTNKQPRINGDADDRPIIDRIIADGYGENKVYVHSATGVVTTSFFELRTDLNKIGLCDWQERHDKYIPDVYFYAPVTDRLNLLAGLLDTDGCLRRKEHRYDFTTSEETLKDSFIKLIATFGWRCCVREIAPHTSSSGIVGKHTYWVISFNPTIFIPCQLERKQLHEFAKPRRNAIAKIEESKHKQGNCITVEGDGMYLAGYNMIPTHNTSILMFYCTWVLGRNSESSNLYSAFSDLITKAFYTGVLEIINDPVTYKWADIFPKSKIVQTNSQDETINLDRKKRYPSLTCRSLYGTLNGACDCNGIEISDDLIGGIEEALNKDRLIAAWSKVDNNLLPRAKEKAKILWCGTRWSIIDPAGIRMELLQNDERFSNRRFKVINLPALNGNDVSNFDYDYGVGFSSDYYKQRRASFERSSDMASWMAQYMGQPIERDGSLFAPDGFRYYNGDLPEEEPDRVFMSCDPAFGGGDFLSAPVCFQYGTDVYVHDVIFSNEDKKTTLPLLVSCISQYKVKALQIEATKSTMGYKDELERMLKEQGIRINITTKPAPTNLSKEQRIYDKAPDIREMMIFREDGKRTKPYSLFMQNVFSFTVMGKNKHDDAPDSLAMAIDMVTQGKRTIQIFSRPF